MSEKTQNILLSIVLVLVVGVMAWGFIMMITSDQPNNRRGGKYRHRTPSAAPAATTTVDANVKTAQ